MSPSRSSRRARRAFTLIELLLAVMIFAIVMLAINTVLFGALRLRQRTTAMLEKGLPLNNALTLMRRDLVNTLPPTGTLAAWFRNGLVGAGTIQSSGLEFYSSTGTLSDETPWGDVEKITYQLMDPVDRVNSVGKDLVRSVTRNLLSPTITTDDPDEQQRLLSGVSTIEYWCYDGNIWRQDWDTTLTDTNLPQAVRLRITLAADDPNDTSVQQPVELLVPLRVQSFNSTNQVSTTSSQ